MTGKTARVEVEEITQPDANAQLIAENIAGQLERRISHSRAMKRAVLQAMRAGVKGVRIEASGRLSGSEMARKEKLWEGRVPRNMIRADLDYGFAEALTTYGRIGIKVWAVSYTHLDVYKRQVYVLRKEEGGRHKAFFPGYRPQFYIRTMDVTGEITLPEGVEMVMPGDNVNLKVKLITPVALEDGQRFAIREGGLTVGAGVITKILA